MSLLFFLPSVVILIVIAFVLAFLVSFPFILLLVLTAPLYAFSVWLDERKIPTRTVMILPIPKGAAAEPMYGPPVAGPNTRGQTLTLVPMVSVGQSVRSRRSKRKTRR